jgi:hypothetical protein
MRRGRFAPLEAAAGTTVMNVTYSKDPALVDSEEPQP